MIITELELISWGRHKHIKESTNSAVLGLLGKNGSGKSTILAAIKYAFTGVLEGKAESWARNFGAPGGAKNGSVRIKFIKDGKEGEIFRQVGSTSKRWLVWDGAAAVTAAKTVDAMLAEIFSANKDAIGTVVFVPQGDLDKLLFGTPTERADLFMKMLLLDFMPKRAELIKQKMDLISAGITDYSTLQDELTTQLETSTRTLEELAALYSKMPDVSSELNRTNDWVQSVRQLENLTICRNELNTFIAEKSAACQSEEARLRQLVAIHRPGVTCTWKGHVEQLNSFRNMHSDWLHNAKMGQAWKEQYDAAKKDYSEADKSLVMAELLLSSREAKLSALPADNLIRDRLFHIKSYEECVLNLRRKKEALREASVKVFDFLSVPEPFSKIQLVTAEKEVVDANTKLQMAKLTKGIFAAVMEANTSMEHSSSCKSCPLCRSQLESLTVTPGDLTAAELELTTCQVAYNKAHGELHRMREALDSYNMERMRLERAEVVAGEEHKKASDAMSAMTEPADSKEALEAQLQECAVARDAVAEARSRKWSAETAAQNTKARLLEFDESRQSTIRKYERDVKEYGDPVAHYDAGLKKIDLALDEILPVFQVVDNMQTTLQGKHSELENVVRQLQDLEGKVKAETVTLGFTQIDVTAACARLDQLKAAQEARSVKQGEILGMQGTVANIRERQADVERKIQADQRKRSLLENLRLLRETLCRGGLPMSVMNHQFKLLAELVQDHLASLGANFSVIPDPDRPISFCFVRTDEEEEYLMPQEKLSGGQKVRLTVAMLLAVQQMIIPEVGFLVLDEPSVHLDDEGVDSLRELFQTIGAKMGSTGAQVVVCDHDQRLKSSFASLIEIKN